MHFYIKTISSCICGLLNLSVYRFHGILVVVVKPFEIMLVPTCAQVMYIHMYITCMYVPSSAATAEVAFGCGLQPKITNKQQM